MAKYANAIRKTKADRVFDVFNKCLKTFGHPFVFMVDQLFAD